MILKKQKLKISALEISVALGLFISVVLMTLCGFSSQCDNVRRDTLRLHILANSDSAADQALKIKVRDAVLSAMSENMGEAKTKQQAVGIAAESIALIEKTAAETIKNEGYNYPVRAYLTNMFFTTRYYSRFTMPAGEYDAIRIEIGSGQGHNWWCVMFPPLCLPAATQEEESNDRNAYSEEERKLISGKYDIRFAVIEWLEKLGEKD